MLKKALKWTGIALGGLLGLIAVSAVGFWLALVKTFWSQVSALTVLPLLSL
jgi:hypothetical protein